MTVNEPTFNTLGKILAVAAVMEIATGFALVIAPALLIPALLGMEGSTAQALGRFVGIAMLSLGIACWPAQRYTQSASSAYWAMQIYNPLAALYLAYLGAVERTGGMLLWPVAGVHLVMTLLLIGARRSSPANP